MKNILVGMLIGAFILAANHCQAGIPHLINYQGMLTENEGNPLNGDFDMTFRIFDDSTSGTQKWGETQYGIKVTDGLFNVNLGVSVVIDLPFDEDYWLEVEVGVLGPLSPRVRMVSVGYAYRAMAADTASYAIEAVTAETDSDWTISGNDIYSAVSGNVGIGTTAPAYKLHVAGQVISGTDNEASGDYSAVGGGHDNSAAGDRSVIGGGYQNAATDVEATIGGGQFNTASGAQSVVAGGEQNLASGWRSVIGGGFGDTASAMYTTVSGGRNNVATVAHATVGGGALNVASNNSTTIAGGYQNQASGYNSTVCGGVQNSATGYGSTVAGGTYNHAGGDYSFAAGYRGKAIHDGAFVWADYTELDFSSTGQDQFLIRASGGVGIGTNSPERILHIKGDNPRILIEASSINPEINFKNYGDSLDHIWALYKHGATDDLRFFQKGDKLTIQNSTGYVGIGTTSPSYRLDVNGDINVSGNIRRTGTPYTHPDYVFESNYRLMPLDELKKYVLENKCLPNVISAKDVKKNNGYNMDELLIQMLEKIEEQTLYIFQLEERIAELERGK